MLIQLIQQGDVLLTKVEEMPADAVLLHGNLLHKGLNHAHTIDKGALYAAKEGTFLVVDTFATLQHDEHGKSDAAFRTVPAGIWKKTIVMEYDHFLEESKEVID